MKRVFGGPARYPIIISIVIVLLFALGWWLLRDAYIPVLMPSGQIAEQQHNLIIFAVVLSGLVVLPVFVLLAIFAWKYREGNAKSKYRPDWAENNKLEMIWWGIPLVIIVVLSVVTYITSHSLDPYRKIESDQPALQVQVVALQWKWLFIYPEQQIATVGELVIPAGRPVHFTLSADAPMSAFWIPALGSQIYSMNSMSSQINLIANTEDKIYKGYNTNINGEGYAKMTFDVKTLGSDGFAKWHKGVAGSSMKLDYAHFDELTSPSIETAPMYMKLADIDLYKKIVAKNMGHGASSGSDGDTMNSMDHEGMGH